MRISMRLEDDLLLDLMKLTASKKKTEAILTAINDYIQRRKLEKLLELKGQIFIEDNWEELRKAELDEEKNHC